MSTVFVPVSYHIAKMSETLPFITNSVQAFFFVGLAVKKRLKCHHGSIGREQTFGENVLHIFSHKFRCVTADACLSFIRKCTVTLSILSISQVYCPEYTVLVALTREAEVRH